jgi:deoxyribodipyrimidine photo-lyase
VFSSLRVRPVDSLNVDERRVRSLLSATNLPTNGLNRPVVYWMSRDQRINDNWAFLRALQIGRDRRAPVHVAFCLARTFPDATRRAYDFMLLGLQQVASDLAAIGVPFHLLRGDVGQELPRLVERLGAQLVVCDFSPLRIARKWRHDVYMALKVPKNVALEEVDAHNIVPCWRASDKQEWAARTLRIKYSKGLLDDYLCEFPPLADAVAALQQDSDAAHAAAAIDWAEVGRWVQTDESVAPVTWATPGERAAREALAAFCAPARLALYLNRNDPTVADGQSNLSPYLHFGQLAPQRAAISALAERRARREAVDSFLEELIIRRELSDNFCYYNFNYDSFEGGPDWAKQSLTLHLGDAREQLYTYEQLRDGATYDTLWNAAQRQLVVQGKMSGFMRMYWAKKIGEWSATPQEAVAHAIKLNDVYSLDGRDPNGYVGVMWSIVGTHDQGWAERAVTGKVRVMMRSGCERKFDVERYIAMVARMRQ